MNSRPKPGIKILREVEGIGVSAEKGDLIEFDSEGYLSRGECIQPRLSMTTKLGSRRVIAGIEYALVGMKPGGFRRVRISPHLAYRDEGVSDKIPANAVLIYDLWLKAIERFEPKALW